MRLRGTLPAFEQVRENKPAFARATTRLHPDARRTRSTRDARPDARRPVSGATPATAAASTEADDGSRSYDLALHAPAPPALRRRSAIPAFEMIARFGHDHARLLRRLHVLLDHLARGARRFRVAASRRS